MHSIHYILIHKTGVDNLQDVKWDEEVGNRIGGDGNNWFDWYSVGGRWGEQLTEKIGKNIWPNELQHKHVFRVGEYRDIALSEIETVMGWQQAEVDEVRRKFTNSPIPNDFVPSMWLSDKPPTAQDRLKWQTKQDEEHVSFSDLLDPSMSVSELHHKHGAFNWAAWQMKKMLEILAGDWNSDSHFYDCTASTANPTQFLDFLRSDAQEYTEYSTPININDLYLVVVDFHS